MRPVFRRLRRRALHSLPPVVRSHAGELGYLSLSALVVAAVLALGAGWWQSAWSPVALDRPAAKVAQGDVQGAIAAYRALASGWGPAPVREEASWRAAQLHTAHADDPARSAELLRTFARAWPDSEHVAAASARLAGVYAVSLDRPLEAAEAWERAAWAAPEHPEAGRWLLEAGRAYVLAGQTERAERALGLATQHEDRAPAAWLALARLRLSTDPSSAYDAYDMALRSAGAGPAANLARLGRVTALERLEGGDAALAQLDEELTAAEADMALVRRQRRLRGDQ